MIISGANKLTNDKALARRVKRISVARRRYRTICACDSFKRTMELSKLKKGDDITLLKKTYRVPLWSKRSSGVLSQILRGFTERNRKLGTCSKDVAQALKESSDVAYKAVTDGQNSC